MSSGYLIEEEELRDPTLHELYNGPTRDQLPEEVQRMDEADLACTFCGVSYLVFSEVQLLQEKLKHHQKVLKVRSHTILLPCCS